MTRDTAMSGAGRETDGLCLSGKAEPLLTSVPELAGLAVC